MSDRELSCEEALRFLAAYIDGELDSAADGDVGRHLERCQSCYSRADFERRLKDRLARLGEAKVPPEFAARVQRLIDTFPTS